MTKSAKSNRVTNVNFDIRVGASVPRSASLHVLPPDVVEIVPEYRGYRYVYVRDEIVIIHPTNYVVVAVIGGDSRVGARSGRITLAADDRVFVRRHLDLGARVRLGIGSISIGMNLPDTVELRPLPTVIVERPRSPRSSLFCLRRRRGDCRTAIPRGGSGHRGLMHIEQTACGSTSRRLVGLVMAGSNAPVVPGNVIMRRDVPQMSLGLSSLGHAPLSRDRRTAR